MTISTTENRKEYAGNDVTLSFAYPFKFFADTDLVVELVDTATNTSVLQTLTSDYTVLGAGLDAGGSVEMIVEPATGEQLVIYWDAAATQLTDYVENDSFPAESHEKALDKLTRLVQRLQDRLNRSVVLSDTDTSGVGLEIPEAALLDRALQFLSFDAAGNLTVAGVVGDIGSFTVSAANIANAIVQRDGNGDFAANEVTAALVIAALTGDVKGNLTGNVNGNVSGTAGAVTFRGAYLDLSADEAIPNNAFTSIPWDTTLFEADEWWDIGAPTRATVPAGVNFVRLVFGAQVKSDLAGVGKRTIRILKNGAQLTLGTQELEQNPASATTNALLNIATTPLPVVAGDYFEFQVFQTSGAPLDVFSSFTYASIETLGQ